LRLLSGAAAESRAAHNRLYDLEAELLDRWVPPPIDQSRHPVLMSFKRNGEKLRIIFRSRGASDAERHTALAETLKRCASLPSRRRFETASPASRSPCASSMIGNRPSVQSRSEVEGSYLERLGSSARALQMCS
jgi:hypothetical protein